MRYLLAKIHVPKNSIDHIYASHRFYALQYLHRRSKNWGGLIGSVMPRFSQTRACKSYFQVAVSAEAAEEILKDRIHYFDYPVLPQNATQPGSDYMVGLKQMSLHDGARETLTEKTLELEILPSKELLAATPQGNFDISGTLDLTGKTPELRPQEHRTIMALSQFQGFSKACPLKPSVQAIERVNKHMLNWQSRRPQ